MELGGSLDHRLGDLGGSLGHWSEGALDPGTLMDVDMVQPMMIVTIGDLGEVPDVNGLATLLPMLEEGMQQSHLPAKNRSRQLGRRTIQFKEL